MRTRAVLTAVLRVDKRATVLVAVLAALLLTPPTVAAQSVPPQPTITSLSSTDCAAGSDGSLYNCSVSARITVRGRDFCTLRSTDGYNGTCTLQLGNYSYGSNFVRQNASSPELYIVLNFDEAQFLSPRSYSFWLLNSVLRQGVYPLSLYWSNVTQSQPQPTLGINFLYAPQLAGLTGCAHNVTDPDTGLVSTTGCVNGQTSITVLTSTPLNMTYNYTVLLFGTWGSNPNYELPITVKSRPASLYSLSSFSLRFIDWTNFFFYAASGLRVLLTDTVTVPLPLTQASLQWGPLSNPQFQALASNSCMQAAPVDVNGTLRVQSITQCNTGGTFWISGSGFEPGYAFYLGYFSWLTCQYINSSLYVCTVTSDSPASSAQLLSIAWQRGAYSSKNAAANLTLALLGPLTVTCITGCAVSNNCTVAQCQPGDVLTVSGTGWARTWNSSVFLIPGLQLPINQQLIGYIDYNTRLISVVVPSWYDLRYTPDYGYSLTMTFGSQTSTLSGALTFDTPPAPVVYSVSGCSLQIGNGTSNCSVPAVNSPTVLTLTGENLYWQNLFVYVGGAYCPGDLFYNQQHYADTPYSTLRIKCYQAAYLTEAWSSLALIISDSPFGAVVIPDAVWFAGSGTSTTSVNTTNLNLLFLLFLLIIPIVIVLVAFLYFRHTQPYRAALVMLAKLRAAQRRADAGRDTSSSPHPEGNFEMAAPAQANAGGGVMPYQPPAVSDVKRHSGSDDNEDVHSGGAVADVSRLGALDSREYGSSSQLGQGEISRIEPLI